MPGPPPVWAQLSLSDLVTPAGVWDNGMNWRGEERRSSGERRVVERRRTMRYDVRTLLIIDGITWIDPDNTERRRNVRRRGDRDTLAIKFLKHSCP